jgi:glycosyltransferase involved in cell wall biosynthesis
MLQSCVQIDLSVIIPVGERHGDVSQLWREYEASLNSLGLTFECIIVLDGPHPEVADGLRRLARDTDRVTLLELTRPFGEATALMAGFQRARGQIIATLPAYPQIDPADLPKLVRALAEADLAVAHRSPRAGTAWEALRRRTFHGIIAKVTGLSFRDLGCCARAMRRRVLEEIVLYGDQHRFLPVLAEHYGLRVAETDLRQSPHDRRQRRYPLREYARRALDIFTVFFLVRFTKKPLRFFGTLGAAVFGAGALVTAWMVLERLLVGHPLADRPALLLSSLLVVLGLQMFAIGLLGELMIFTHARDLRDYQIDRVIEFHADDGKAGGDSTLPPDGSPAPRRAPQTSTGVS